MNDRAPTETSLATIEAACRDLGHARDQLRQTVDAMQGDIRRAQERYRRQLQRQIDAIANAHDAALSLVREAPGLFEKPRSVQFHGVKCGYQKGRGKVEWDDDERVAQRVAKYLPGEMGALIKTTRKPIASALAQQPAAMLKRLGVTLSDAEDEAFVKPVDSELDRIVKTLVDDAIREEGGQ
ncbi:MAG: hypothetical protein KDH15_12145 [Rhodocyclaceae bacterium]|nr:hypothetical protein [Rhodocyclaceae bacterium]